jgi:hypothetical protein
MSEAEVDADADAGGGWRGHRFVLVIYACIVAITGVFGYVIGLVRPENLDPRLFGVIALPPTPTGVALYGMLTVATLLGLLLYAVDYVSRRFDDASVEPDPEPGGGDASTDDEGA